MIDILPGIPRIYTALAEWLACAIYILPLSKRFSRKTTVLLLICALFIQIGVQYLAGLLPLAFWILGMLFSVFLMFCYIAIIYKIPLNDIIHYCVMAFITAEFAASLGWLLYCAFIYGKFFDVLFIQIILMSITYASIFGIILLLESRKNRTRADLSITRGELFSITIIAVLIFSMSNINLIVENIAVSMTPVGLYYLRAIIDFCGVCILFAFQEQRVEVHYQQELEAMNNLLDHHYNQYEAFKNNNEVLQQQFHDFKHQIAMIRSESDLDKRASYLQEFEENTRFYEVRVETGNSILDTVLTSKSLYCFQHQINLTCVIDGQLLDFMHPMDLCAIFGNSLDNAIESVEKLEKKEERLITVAVKAHQNFLLIEIANYTAEKQVPLNDGTPLTTKKNKNLHGYGIKSTRKIVESYGGRVSLSAQNHWFNLTAMIPLHTELMNNK